MAGYRVILTERAKKDMKKLPPEIWNRFDEALTDLSLMSEPRQGVKRLKGNSPVPFYSLRVGSYRAIMNIFDDRLIISVISADQRKTVYRKF